MGPCTPLLQHTALTLRFHPLGPGKSGPRPDCLWAEVAPGPGGGPVASPWHSCSVPNGASVLEEHRSWEVQTAWGATAQGQGAPQWGPDSRAFWSRSLCLCLSFLTCEMSL